MITASTVQRSQTGFSIVELMVAITLGAILLGGAVSLFVNNRQSYEINNDLSRLQENARFALQMISADLRMAGYVGCNNNQDGVSDNISAGNGELWDPSFSVEGFDNTGTTWLPSGRAVTTEAAGGTGGSAGTVLAGTDAVTIRYLQGDLNDNGDGLGGTTADGTIDLRVTGEGGEDFVAKFFVR